ncbi:hypothetical protein GIB67_017969 [Kingdonia uniflora]|uniref:RNase H type-1 domain-containing protein n=1 Tax=Kingdonia uniflora TaxID=39325 RepID=A0A7J7MIA4_9MAGN|nr:hypothetical protein GIB67_017969 [Kingdonia uniflora]
MKAITDGASRGNPGRGGLCVVFRDGVGYVKGVIVQNLRHTTSYMVKCLAIFAATGKAYMMNWLNLTAVSDSQAAVDSFNKNCLSWQLTAKWESLSGKYLLMFIIHGGKPTSVQMIVQ